MSSSNSTFVVEIVLEQLKSYVKCKEFIVKAQFADIFYLNLKNCCNVSTIHKTRRRIRNRKIKTLPLDNKGQSVAFISEIDNLISNMQKYPIELTLWSQRYPEYKLASSNIPWSSHYIRFLNKLRTGGETEAVTSTSGEYKVFDEFTSRRMASVKLNIKLSYLPYAKENESSRQFDVSDLNNHKLKVKPSTVINTIPKVLLPEEIGIIKTIYRGGKKHKKHSTKKDKKRNEKVTAKMLKPKMSEINLCKKVNSLLLMVKSEINLHKNKKMDLLKTKSCSVIQHDKFNFTNYIFGDNTRRYGYQVYCVNYFTVENDTSKDTESSVSSKVKNTDTNKSSTKESSLPEEKDPVNFSMKYCSQECRRHAEDTGSVDLNTIEIPILPTEQVNVSKCSEVICEGRTFRPLPPPPDKTIYLDLTALNKDDCVSTVTVEKVEQVVGELKAKMKIGKSDPCYCECECMFGVTKKTTYCKICKGFEQLGEDMNPKRDKNIPEGTDTMKIAEMILDDMPPIPCPVYHNLMDKLKQKPSATGSDSKQKTKAKVEKKKKKKENKFKFNYGYTASKIGHENCLYPGCGGAISGPVPHNMGWLWNATDIQGLKFRPSWRPGATPKHIVHLLKLAKNPGEVLTKKKKKKIISKPRRPNKRPLLTVHKKEGEYTIGLETMKTYPKPRNINQVPFEDKDPLIYKLGRTDEENRARQKKKERIKRRLEREQREFIQGAFRDMCEEICLKTYQQALGILPDAEKPDCTCYPAEPGADRTDLDHSCSCSEDSISLSDTDSDEWLVEVTPPVATYDPTYKVKKSILSDAETQYTYLDFRVKLVDRYGNPVPRFFIGPDGKEECSDLGGFWSPDKKWLEINVDGYVGPDGRWAPNTFIGPAGEQVDAETGKFQTMDGVWLVVGIDGYVDSTGKWRYYSKTKGESRQKTREKRDICETKKPQAKLDEKEEKRNVNVKFEKVTNKDKSKVNMKQKKSETTWSCFGDASAKYLSEMGIMGHGHDRKLLLDTLKTLIASGESVKVPRAVVIPHTGKRFKRRPTYHDERKCRHATPSSKGVIAVDDEGNKIYFRIKDSKNPRPSQRIATLTDQGISVEQGWAPGAISKRLLRQLKKAKQRTSPVEQVKVTKKIKKHVEDKPTLIICKKNGEYHVELQAYPENSDTNVENCSPLIYKIKTADNEERIQKRLRKRQRLINNVVNKVWSDPYHPEVCEKTCLKAYKQAVGLLPYDPNKPECICPNYEAEVSPNRSCDETLTSSGGSSLDLQWEIHFSPPSAYFNDEEDKI